MTERPPRDVVPPQEHERAHQIEPGAEVTITLPGDPIYDVDGIWAGMTRNTVHRMTALENGVFVGWVDPDPEVEQ
jgi:hypothetical protein